MKHARLIWSLAAALVSIPYGAAAQTALSTIRPDIAAEIADAGVPMTLQGQPDVDALLRSQIDYVALVSKTSGRTVLMLLRQLEEERADEQVGSTSSSAGTTTLVSKGTVPKILALAVENGAISRTQSGTTVTLRSNLGGSIQALAGRGFLQIATGADPAIGILRRVSLSASFDTSRGTTDAATFTADQQQLSQWTARYEVINHRDPRGPVALARWQTEIAASLRGVSSNTQRLYQALLADPAVLRWFSQTVGQIATLPARTPTAVEAVLVLREPLFPADTDLQTETRAALEQYEHSSSVFIKERHDLLGRLASGPLVTVEYSNDRPLEGPSLSNVRLIGAVGGTLDLTGNASLSFFSETPAGATGQMRDLQLSGQMDLRLGSSEDVGAFIFSIAAKYVRQFEDTIDASGIAIPGTKGTIATGQLKLTMPVKGSGVRVPLSITFANRTDLINESIVRANIGLSYDLDAVFSRFKP